MDLAEVEAYIDEKMSDVEKFVAANDPESVRVDFEVEKTTAHHQNGDVFRAEANLFVDGAQFRAESTEEEIHAAIDKVKDELSRQIKDRNNKDRTKERHGGAILKNLLRGFRK